MKSELTRIISRSSRLALAPALVPKQIQEDADNHSQIRIDLVDVSGTS